MSSPDRKRARKLSNEGGFALSKLPLELQEMVFAKVDTRSALRLLQVTKYTRDYILSNGVFGNSVERIEFGVDPVEIYVISRSKSLDDGFTFKFNEVATHLTHIRSTRLVILKDDVNLVGTFCKFVPQFRFTSKLLVLVEFSTFLSFFKNSRFHIDSCCQFTHFEELADLNDELEAEIFEFVSANANTCRRLDFNFYPVNKSWNFLRMTRIEYIHFMSYNETTAKDFYKRLLRDGVPSQAEAAQIQFDFHSPKHAFIFWMINQTRSMGNSTFEQPLTEERLLIRTRLSRTKQVLINLGIFSSTIRIIATVIPLAKA